MEPVQYSINELEVIEKAKMRQRKVNFIKASLLFFVGSFFVVILFFVLSFIFGGMDNPRSLSSDDKFFGTIVILFVTVFSWLVLVLKTVKFAREPIIFSEDRISKEISLDDCNSPSYVDVKNSQRNFYLLSFFGCSFFIFLLFSNSFYNSFGAWVTSICFGVLLTLVCGSLYLNSSRKESVK